MDDILRFSNRDEFRAWLEENCMSGMKVRLLFGKKNCTELLIPYKDAVEEALCFGWIDGHMKSLDEFTYMRSFCMRRPHSNWSEINKALVGKLELQGKMTDWGRAKVEEAKKNGQWNKPQPAAITEENIRDFAGLLAEHEPAYTHFMEMPPSVRKTYIKAYQDAKTDAGRHQRLTHIIERLKQNLRPM